MKPKMRGNGTKRRIFWHKMNDEKSVREKEIEWRKIRWETVWYLRKVRIWKNISNIPETWKKCWIKHKYSHSLSAHIPAAHFLFLMRMLYVSLCILWDFFSTRSHFTCTFFIDDFRWHFFQHIFEHMVAHWVLFTVCLYRIQTYR